MSSRTVERVVEQIRQLSIKEQIELRNLLNQIPLTEEEIDKQFQEKLLTEGLISEIKPSRLSLPQRDFKPIEIKGKPISETII